MQELISRIKKGNPRMKYDFDTVVNRRNTDSLKWNVAENELPMWVADMDFKTAPEITEAIKAKALPMDPELVLLLKLHFSVPHQSQGILLLQVYLLNIQKPLPR